MHKANFICLKKDRRLSSKSLYVLAIARVTHKKNLPAERLCPKSIFAAIASLCGLWHPDYHKLNQSSFDKEFEPMITFFIQLLNHSIIFEIIK
jgi:hypothetical protein